MAGTKKETKAPEEETKEAEEETEVEEDTEETEFAGQHVQTEHYNVTTDDHFGVGVVRLGKVGGVGDSFVIPQANLGEVIEALQGLK